jgi:hypothetical protein
VIEPTGADVFTPVCWITETSISAGGAPRFTVIVPALGLEPATEYRTYVAV